MRGSRPSRTIYIVLGVLLVLLPLLAVLQYRWIGEVSQADRRRLEEHLNQAGMQFVADFNRELGRVLTTFQVRNPPDSPDLAPWFLQQSEEAAASYPSLIKRVFLMRRTEGGLTLQQFNPQAGELESVEWPPEFKVLHDTFDVRMDSSGRSGPPPQMDPMSGGNPVFPVPARIPMAQPVWALVEFNAEVFSQEFLPPVVARHFPETDKAQYRIAILKRGGATAPIFKSDSSIADDEFAKPDLRLPLFGPDAGRGRPPAGPPPGNGFGPGGPRPGRGDRARGERRGMAGPPFVGTRGGPGPALAGAWELVVRHRSGSLDTAIESLRRRNLAISFGILLLLASSVVLVVISSHRARSLAQLQMDFVARVSHELRTPLAIIRSAAYNVANGVVSDEKEVREYATMVQAEGQRLSTMVDQILSFSRTEKGRGAYDVQALDVSAIIDRVVGLHQAGSVIDLDIAANLPRVKADERALTDCLQNLVSNALKYGEANAGKRIKVEARRSDSNTVIISVADSGPGIDAADLPHIFEPFYRGRNARSDTPGSGLGLNLVRRLMTAQGGKVTVESQPSRGARFTLHLAAVVERTA